MYEEHDVEMKKKITNKHIGREISKKNLKERKIIKSVEQKILWTVTMVT